MLTLAVGAFFHVTAGTIEPIATQLVAAVIVAIGTISMGRIGLRFFLHTLTTTRVLVVGGGQTAERIMMNVRRDPGMTLLGRVVDGDFADGGALGGVADLPDLCRELHVHRILVAADDKFSSGSLDIYRDLQESVHIAMVPRYFELISWRSRLTDLGGMPFLEIAQPHMSPWDRFMKRTFDLCVSSLVLVLLSPILLFVVIRGEAELAWTRLLPPGTARPLREPFMVYKFRSMTTDVGEPISPGAGLEGDSHHEQPLHQARKKHDESN